MKLCVDCINMSNGWRDKVRALCKHELSIYKIDPIDGQKYYSTCYDMRSVAKPCGEKASLFEPKYE